MRYAEDAHLGSFILVLLVMIFTLLWSCYQKFLDKKKPRFRRGLKNAFLQASISLPPHRVIVKEKVKICGGCCRAHCLSLYLCLAQL